ncbi:MAG: VOC family protein [Gemmatimonadota bacterium]|nr:VOC family protein [Gemmatimonadota bacterium]
MTGCPMLVVDDVEGSAAWYAEILGGSNVHPGDEFAMIMHDAALVVMLHHRDFDEHPALTVPDDDAPGTGILLYFWVDDLDAAYRRAREREARLLDEPHVNPNAGAREFSLRDPDGYAVTIAEKRREGGP